MENRHRPSPGHHVPDDFLGICVASSPDPATDRYIIDRLRDLGVRQVRVDYGFDSPNDHVSRFLDALLENSFNVFLHLVQPLDAARKMAQESVQDEWRQFVADSLDRYGQRVDAVEIGATVNRRRWAGYDLKGFVTAWRIAFEETHRRGVTICGPNVTDFEPLYTAGLLHLLRKSGTPPHAYTNNLFVERVIEPEAYDHRIAGRLATPLLRMNLIKKWRLLQAAAQRYDVMQFWNSYVSWTHPRIRRNLPNVESKQADYLTRYLVLSAAADSVQRLYWGPLVSRREGLIDDPDNGNHYEELVTFYGHIHGPASRFRERPAYRAMRQVCATIPGSRYLGRLVDGDGLEVHAFESAAHLTHIAWVRNAAAARLNDIYRNDDIEAAASCSRDGEVLLQPPPLITETPTYLYWPAGRPIAVNHAARPIPALSVDLHQPGGEYFPFQDGPWRGMVVARDAEHARALLTVLHPACIRDAARIELLRKARNAIWTIDDPTHAGRKLVIKQPVKLRVNKRLLERFRPSKAVRSFSGACELRRRGIASPRPVAYFERAAGGPGLTENWYVCEYESGRLSVRDFFTAYAAGESRYQGIALQTFLDRLVPFLLELHKRGVFFRDLSGGNLLVTRNADRKLDFTLIDTARARIYPGGVSLRQRLSDMKRIGYKLHWEGRTLLMEQYLAGIGRTFALPYRLPFYLYDLKIALKRRARRRSPNRALASEPPPSVTAGE